MKLSDQEFSHRTLQQGLQRVIEQSRRIQTSAQAAWLVLSPVATHVNLVRAHHIMTYRQNPIHRPAAARLGACTIPV